MRKFSGLDVYALALLGCGLLGYSSVEADDTPAWAKDYLRAWYAAFNAGDATAVGNLYSEDAAFGTERGRAAIVASFKRDLATTSYHCVGGFQAIKEVAGTAVGWGIDTCKETPRAGGASQKTRELWLMVFERQPDGHWLGIRETWEDLPADLRK
jgi:ketosteroid isomerase-like protein